MFRKIFILLITLNSNKCYFLRNAIQENEYQLLKGHLLKKIEEKVPDIFERWTNFKTEKNIQNDDNENKKKFFVYAKNIVFIHEHNSDPESTHEVGENALIHMSREEYFKLHGIFGDEMNQKLNNDNIQLSEEAEDRQYEKPPPPIDWRTKNKVSPVKEQNNCGGCYAFSTVGALESAIMIKNGTSYDLSEQNVIDCSTKYGNHLCEGGTIFGSFDFMRLNSIPTESTYPYLSRNATCKPSHGVSPLISAYVAIPMGNELALAKALSEHGPVSVCIDARWSSFRFYKSGVYKEFRCTQSVTHAMLAVGFSEYPTPNYIVKNSWGLTFGDKGYILLARNMKNSCGITNQAAYPILK